MDRANSQKKFAEKIFDFAAQGLVISKAIVYNKK